MLVVLPVPYTHIQTVHDRNPYHKDKTICIIKQKTHKNRNQNLYTRLSLSRAMLNFGAVKLNHLLLDLYKMFYTDCIYIMSIHFYHNFALSRSQNIFVLPIEAALIKS